MGTRLECYRSGTLTIKDALQFFDRLLAAKNPAPSIYSFNQLFTSLTRMKNSNNHYATIFSLFNRWTQSRGVSPSPDVCTYSVLIDYCIRINQPRLSLVFLGRFIKGGQRAEPNILNPLLKGLCSENRISEAVAIAFNKMPKLGCTPNVISYSTVIDGLCKEGAISKAFNLFERMLSEGIAPNVFMYSSPIDGCWKESIRVFKDQGFLPNEVTYESMMDSSALLEALEAEKLLDLMVRGGIKPDVVSYRILLIGFANYGTIDDVMKILDRMQVNHVAPDLSTYTSLLKAYAKNRKVDQAMCMLNRMRQEGVKPDLAASAAILELLLEMGRDEDAKVVMDQTSGKTND